MSADENNFWEVSAQPPVPQDGQEDDGDQGSAPPVFDFWPSYGEGTDGIYVLDPSQGVTSITGSVASDGEPDDADSAYSGYHLITGFIVGNSYTFEAHRLESDLDPAMWVFENLYTFASFLASGTLDDDRWFSTGTIDYLGYGDDDIAHPGPYSDPRVNVDPAETESMTAVVTNYASGPDDGGDSRFDYRLDIINHDPGDPEPGVWQPGVPPSTPDDPGQPPVVVDIIGAVQDFWNHFVPVV